MFLALSCPAYSPIGVNPYPEYKDSGLPWLDRIPSHWQVRRAKFLFTCVDIRSRGGDEELLTVSSRDGVIPRREKTVTMFMAESYKGHKLCWPGDLVINSLWAWAQGLGFSRHHGMVSPAYGVYRPGPGLSAYWPYFDYLLRSRAYDWEFRVRSKGIWLSRLQLTDKSFMDMPILLPPKDEAETMTRFLESASIHADRVIRAKRRLIELLNEQKQVLIHRAVTRGLDPSVPLKPSGIDWLGDVPHSWPVLPLKRVARLQRGYDLPEHEREAGPFPVVSSGGVIGTHRKALVKAPGVVTGRYGSTGSVYYIDADFWPHNTSLYVSEFSGNDSRFVYYLLQTLAFDAHSGKSAVPGIDRKDLHAISVACPGPKEQKAIVRYLDVQLTRFDEAASIVSRQTEAVREYRGFDVVIEPRLTHGCRLDNLRDYLNLAPRFAGVIIAIDGGGLSRKKKTAKLSNECPITHPTLLWSVAEPSVEEWLMADGEALPSALRRLFGAKHVKSENRPGRSKSEGTAKKRLRGWVEGLLGEPTLRGGAEYAADVAKEFDPSRVGPERNPDLREVLDQLPDSFVSALSRHSAPETLTNSDAGTGRTGLVQRVDRTTQPGPTMRSGRTSRSNSSAVR